MLSLSLKYRVSSRLLDFRAIEVNAVCAEVILPLLVFFLFLFLRMKGDNVTFKGMTAGSENESEGEWLMSVNVTSPGNHTVEEARLG